MLYVYCFVAYPDETKNIPLAMFELFKYLSLPIEVIKTEEEFNMFKNTLYRLRITLREITRVVYIEPETV